MSKITKSPVLYIVLLVVGVWVAVNLFLTNAYQSIRTEEGLELIKSDSLVSVRIVDRDQRVDLELATPYKNHGTKVQFNYVSQRATEIVNAVNKAKIKDGFTDEVPAPSVWGSIISMLLPIAAIGLFLWFMAGPQAAGGRGIAQFSRMRSRLISKEMPKVRFTDVAGADEAVEELQEIKDFLSDPDKYRKLGARIPKGVLLFGPPGTGKTLLARAVAGEAGVPFFSISGSDFVEMFVGVGASRVRDLFEQAKQNSPSIIFIDEIDAVGRRRGSGFGGGHDEREQTLNQLLVEMDGFDVKTNIILIAATNRSDVLDSALLRPGRFDRHVAIDAPNLQGRLKILQVHARTKPVSKSVDLEVLARKTPGFTGADLANVLNEAALLTARSDAQIIDDRALDEAVDRVMAGPQRRSRVMTDHEKLVTAYHEAGHALTAAAMRYSDPVTKVTILPRSRALGYTMVMPVQDRYSVTRNELLDKLAYAMGGRAAEELVFHDPTTGASNDIEKATSIARKMVTEFGLSKDLGAVKFGNAHNETLMGVGQMTARDYSEVTAERIDVQVRALIQNAHDEAWEVISNNRNLLDDLALNLLEKETLNQDEIAEIFKGVRKLPERHVWQSAPNREPSNKPPVKYSAMGPDSEVTAKSPKRTSNRRRLPSARRPRKDSETQE